MMQQPALTPDFNFIQKAEASGPFNATQCFQCRKCTNGCPASFAMDLFPDQIIRLAVLGQKEAVLKSRTIWVCASCETCSTRCPNGVRIAELMDYFKELALKEGISPAQPTIAAFHKAFLDNLKLTGRVFEAGLLPSYWFKSGQVGSKIKSGEMFKEFGQGMRLLRKGRLAALPGFVKGRSEVRSILRSSR